MRPSFLYAFALLTLPWINPVAPGPSAAVLPWLVACWCAGALLLVQPPREAGLVAGTWLASALLSVVFGLIQYTGATAHLMGWINAAQPGEAFANLRQRNQFASLTNIGLLALVYLGQTRVGASHRFAIGAVAAAALLGVGNAASSSRTGLLQLMVLSGVLVFWGSWRLPAVRRLLLASLAGYGLATMVLPLLIGAELGGSGILGRFNERGAACQSRWVLWDNVLTLIAQKPWLGWGWGELDYAHFITLYPGDANARFCDILDNAHNLPLHLAVELGVPFALAVCLALAGVVLWLRPWRDQNPARQLGWGVLLLIGLHSLLEYPLWYGPFQIAVGLCVLILWQTHRQRGPAPAPAQPAAARDETGGVATLLGDVSPAPEGEVPHTASRMQKPIVHMTASFLAIIIIAIVSYAMWDYHRISQIYLIPSERSAAYRYNTLDKIRGSWLFQNHVQFAELTTTGVTAENAPYVYAQAQRLLHFSPEARVVEKLIDSATLLNLDDEVAFFKQRYQAAFPKAFARWQASRPPR